MNQLQQKQYTGRNRIRGSVHRRHKDREHGESIHLSLAGGYFYHQTEHRRIFFRVTFSV